MTAVKKLASPETYLESGQVERVGASLTVRLTSGATFSSARRAKSCLCAPEAGDRVLCAVEADTVFVLAVLEGREGAPTKLIADGDLELQARGGRVSVTGTEGVELVSGREVSVTSPELHVRAQKGTVAVQELGFFGRLVQAEVTRLALVAHDVDTVVTRLTQRAKRVFRFVEEIDQTRAGTIDLRAQDLVGIRGENTVISARVLTKVDAEQIHLG